MQGHTAQKATPPQQGGDSEQTPLPAPSSSPRCSWLQHGSCSVSAGKGKVWALMSGLALAGVGLVMGGVGAGVHSGCFATYQACRGDGGGMSTCQAAANDQCHFTTHVALIATGCAICILLVPLLAAGYCFCIRRQEQMEQELGTALRRASSGAYAAKILQQQGAATSKGIPANVTLTYIPKSIYGPDLHTASSSSDSGDEASSSSSNGSPRAPGEQGPTGVSVSAQWRGMWPAGGPPGPPDWPAGVAAAAADMPMVAPDHMQAYPHPPPKISRFSFFKQVRVFPSDVEVAA